MKYILAFFVLLFCGCSSTISDNEALVDKMSAFYIQKLCQEERMALQGSGGGMSQGIEILSFSYVCPRFVNCEEARELMMRCIILFLDTINRNLELRPILKTYPYPPSGLELMITFYPFDPDSKENFVYRASLKNGVIYYSTYGPTVATEFNIHVETYEEALKKVSKSSL